MSEISAQDRLDVIAQRHAKEVDESGGSWGECTECGWSWPCATYRWATQSDVTPNCSWDLDECAFDDHDHSLQEEGPWTTR